MGMIMHDDVPYGEGTSYTPGTGIAINNNIIAVDADNTPTENSEKPIKSKGVYEEIEQIYADNGVLGAKNLLPNNATSQTINGVTFTVNADGSITANGTATANANFNLITNGAITVDGLLLSGCFGGSVSSYYIRAQIGSDYKSVYDGESVPLSNGTLTNMWIGIISGQTVSNLTFYPMLRLASDPDDTYVPYAMTNRELTEKVNKSTETFGQVDAYRNNGVVMLKFKGTSITEADGMTLGTLSEKYRPIVEFRTMTKVYNGSSYVDVQVNINTSGVVKLMSTTGQAIASIQPIFTLLTPVFIPSID